MMADKECKAIKLVLEDDTEKVIEHGCVITIQPAEEDGDVRVQMHFLDGADRQNLTELFYVLRRFAGGGDDSEEDV